MKASLILDSDGTQQLVLSPSNDDEEFILKKFAEKPVKIFFGSYYLEHCIGGWIRQFVSEKSLIITILKEEVK